MQPKALQNPKRRKALIYAGVAAAMLIVVMLYRRSSSASSSATPTAQPVANPAVDPNSYLAGSTTGAGGIDPSAQLAAIDTDIQTLAQAVAANGNNVQTPGASTPGVVGTDPTGLGELVGAVVGAVSAGAQIAGAQSPPQSQPGPGNTPPVKPSATVRPTQTNLLAPGAKEPSYNLVRPANVPSSARWSGSRSPGSGWKGVGGGWWVKK